jgi:hypothetical protein
MSGQEAVFEHESGRSALWPHCYIGPRIVTSVSFSLPELLFIATGNEEINPWLQMRTAYDPDIKRPSLPGSGMSANAVSVRPIYSGYMGTLSP